MNQYKIYLATDVTVTAKSAEDARDKALCGFMEGIMRAGDSFTLKVADVVIVHVPTNYLPE